MEDMTKVYGLKPDGQVSASLIKGLCAVGELTLAGRRWIYVDQCAS